MSEPTYSIPNIGGNADSTGRFVVTFRDERQSDALALLKQHGGVNSLLSASDFDSNAMDIQQFESAGGAIFPSLGVAVLAMDDDRLNSVVTAAAGESAILDIEPERVFHAIDDSSPLTYLDGYRDAVNNIAERINGDFAVDRARKTGKEPAQQFVDDSISTWGLKATRAVNSRYTGSGIKVAVLDTGMDLKHPDFRNRSIVHESFINGQSVQDGNGHGTHCIGTACGTQDANGRRYGVAGSASIFAGKVLSNGGSGSTSGILAGMEWAISNGCEIVSMSLGNSVPFSSTAYETIGRRALQRGSIIIAAAGNHRQFGNADGSQPGTVGQPANSPSLLAVAALDNRLDLAAFSCTSGSAQGAAVDIAGPGVAVYSSWPVALTPSRYRTISGTSMATPHVAGIAALYAEAYRARGAELWQLLVSRARRLSLPTPDVGSGLVLAPE